MTTGFLIGVMWSLTAGVATLAGPIHMIRLRRAQGLPNHPVFTVGWVLGLLTASVAPWLLAPALDPDGSMGNLQEAWVIGLPIGLVLGPVAGVLWARASLNTLRTYFPELLRQK